MVGNCTDSLGNAQPSLQSPPGPQLPQCEFPHLHVSCTLWKARSMVSASPSPAEAGTAARRRKTGVQPSDSRSPWRCVAR